eukprot:scaffold82916_cov25-Tisochrysis_lutea.AAC.1
MRTTSPFYYTTPDDVEGRGEGYFQHKPQPARRRKGRGARGRRSPSFGSLSPLFPSGTEAPPPPFSLRALNPPL